MSKVAAKLPLKPQYFLHIILAAVLSLPSAVFSSIEFPENSLPDILQKISKAKLKNQINEFTNHPQLGSISTYNKENKLAAYFYNDRVTFKQHQNAQWEMRLQQYGFAGALTKVNDAEPEITDHMILYQHDQTLAQWYINSDLGIEHGIKLTSPPARTDPADLSEILSFKFQVSGNVKFLQHENEFSLVDTAGNILFWYHNIIAFDENNQYLPIKTIVDGNGLSFLVDASTATYPIYIDPLFTTEKKVGGTNNGDQFGRSVAISGDTVVIGVPNSNEVGTAAGIATIHRKNSSGRNIWGMVKELNASVVVDGAGFGRSVALNESTIVVGAPNENGNKGAVYIFYRDEGGAQNWGQAKKIVSNDIVAEDLFGTSVSLSGETLVVGAPGSGGTGAVYIFDVFEGVDNWGQTYKITLPSSVNSDRFGESVSVDAETLVVGAPGEGSNTGAAYVYYFEQSLTYAARLIASPEKTNAKFGSAVSVYEENLVVGAPFNLNDNTELGAAFVYSEDVGGDSKWGQTTTLTGDATQSDNFGFSVSIYQSRIAIGANKDDNNGLMHGAVYIFTQDQSSTSSWPLFKKYRASEATTQDASYNGVFKDTGNASLYGEGISISGDTMVVGGSESLSAGTGATYIYSTSVDIEIQGNQSSATDVNDSVSYFFTVLNNDPEFAATGVVFQASVSKSLKVSSAIPSLGNCDLSIGIICNIGTIENNSSTTVEIKGNVSSFGLYGVRARVAANQSDAVTGNNSLGVEDVLQDTRGISNSVDKVGCSLSSSGSFDLTLLLLVVFSLLALMKRRLNVN